MIKSIENIQDYSHAIILLEKIADQPDKSEEFHMVLELVDEYEPKIIPLYDKSH